jgi:predicted Holliday junction resolvase-like endonuclease
VAIECKTGTGKLSPDQKKVRDAMIKSGIKYIVVRDNIDELIKYFEE